MPRFPSIALNRVFTPFVSLFLIEFIAFDVQFHFNTSHEYHNLDHQGTTCPAVIDVVPYQGQDGLTKPIPLEADFDFSVFLFQEKKKYSELFHL